VNDAGQVRAASPPHEETQVDQPRQGGALDQRGCRLVHEAALRLLSEVGCAVGDPESRELFAGHGAKVDGERVRFGEALVEQARATVPAGYTVAGRRPELDLRVGMDAPPVLASASGPPFVLMDGEYRPGRLADLRVAVALGHLSPNIQVQGYSVEPTDVREDMRARTSAHVATTGSDKATRFTVTNLEELGVATGVNEILFGAEWHQRPRIWSIINSTSPLQLSTEAGQVLLRLARLGQPVCVAVCAMGGTTAPVTLAGLLAVQHAELLVGLVLTQLANPGNPFLYGGTSSLSSMQSGALMMGAPEYWSLMAATLQLGHWLGVPVRAGGSLTDAHLPDAQAGIESALAIATVLRHNVQYVLHAAGILSSFNCYAPAKFVIDDEVLTALRVAAQPIVVDDETLALDVVAAAGPGGTVLGQKHTRRHARDSARPSIMNRAPYEVWQGLGGRDLAEAAARKVVQLHEEYEPPDDLDLVVRRQLDAFCLD
jgi:trimethylamine---corrinoid protein Co-methyltransferase